MQLQEFLQDLSHIDILKVGHQGSKTSTSSELLQQITPDVAVITVGPNNYGHPSPLIVDRLQQAGAEVLRTDRQGDIRISTSGNEPELLTEH